ncbi:MAG: hypothetical protein ACRYFX_05690 [Janthinobacterium lividum]
MGSLPQLRRDLGEVEHQLQLARLRLAGYQLAAEPVLRAHAGRVVAGLEQLRATLATRLQTISSPLVRSGPRPGWD